MPCRGLGNLPLGSLQGMGLFQVYFSPLEPCLLFRSLCPAVTGVLGMLPLVNELMVQLETQGLVAGGKGQRERH